jgi:hypothetical protein
MHGEDIKAYTLLIEEPSKKVERERKGHKLGDEIDYCLLKWDAL